MEAARLPAPSAGAAAHSQEQGPRARGPEAAAWPSGPLPSLVWPGEWRVLSDQGRPSAAPTTANATWSGAQWVPRRSATQRIAQPQDTAAVPAQIGAPTPVIGNTPQPRSGHPCTLHPRRGCGSLPKAITPGVWVRPGSHCGTKIYSSSNVLTPLFCEASFKYMEALPLGLRCLRQSTCPPGP